MAEPLTIWFDNRRIATIEENRRGRIYLQYTPEALDSYPAGSPLLSLKLPLSSTRFADGMVRPFLDGLLPEGEARSALAAEFQLILTDTFGLLRRLGRDCAGALVIQPEGDPHPAQPTTLTAEPLTDEMLADLVSNLRSTPLGVDQRVRVSLAGMQEKLLLTRMPDGLWGRPVDGTPSTHILKPDHPNYPQTVQNEAFCMRLAKHLGLSVAEVDTIAIAGRQLIVVSRYDRLVDTSGHVQRIHQEDFCQAMGIPPKKKYQDDGGPSLRQMAQILQLADPQSIADLLRAVVLHVVVGNCDAHGKNYSLLHNGSAGVRLAPLYDVMSTTIYHIDVLAMYIDTVQKAERVTVDRLVNEAASWGLPRATTKRAIEELLEVAPAAIRVAADTTPEVPDTIPELVEKRLAALRG